MNKTLAAIGILALTSTISLAQDAETTLDPLIDLFIESLNDKAVAYELSGDLSGCAGFLYSLADHLRTLPIAPGIEVLEENVRGVGRGAAMAAKTIWRNHAHQDVADMTVESLIEIKKNYYDMILQMAVPDKAMEDETIKEVMVECKKLSPLQSAIINAWRMEQGAKEKAAPDHP